MNAEKNMLPETRPAPWMILAAFLFFSISLLLNPPVQAQTHPNPAPKDIPACVVKDETLVSMARNKTTHYLAFVPEKDSSPKYPVLFLLHGAWDDYRAWYQHAGENLCELAAQHNIIIITPDGDPFGWYADSPYVPDNQIETYFINELIPHVKEHLPVNGLMSIAGLSMGGHGALILAMKHPGLFRSAGSISGILDITRHRNQFKLKDVFGPYESNSALWLDHAVDHLAGIAADDLKTLPMLITVSEDDPWAFQENLAFHRHLERLGVEHEFRVDPGKHDWAYWMGQLPGQVAFHARHLSR